MRNGLLWIFGFALTFIAVFVFLLAFSLAQPSLWLPAAFGIALYGILSFSPKFDSRTKAGIALVFGAGSCMLWTASGEHLLDHDREALRRAFEIVLCLPALIGLFIVLISVPLKPPKLRPALGPVAVLLVLGWLISYFSSTHGGASPMVEWVMRHLGLGRHAAEVAVVAFRKTVHFTFYGFVTLMGLTTAIRNGAVGRICVVAALATTLAYASFDELRQSTQVDRTGSVWDVLLDMAGGSVALVAVYALRTTKQADRPTNTQKSSTL